jgi:CBS domain-containing protein
VNFFEYVSTLLKKLSEARVLSALITTSDKPGYAGFVDVLDILNSILDKTKESPNFSGESMTNMQWAGKCFALEKTGYLVNLSQQDPLKFVSPNSSLEEAAKWFALGIHRLAVMDDNRIVNVISQSDLIRFLATAGVYIGSKILKPIDQIGLQTKGVNSVSEDMTVYETIKFMKEKSLSGVPIVDQNNRIVANFSGTDLLGLTDTNFPMLNLPVKEYLQQFYGFPKPPVCVQKSDTLELALLKMVVHEVHRVYIVNQSMRCEGVLSATDLIQFLFLK